MYPRRSLYPPAVHSPPCSVKRVWLPNVQRKHLYSSILGRSLTLNVTTAALRQMDRLGGVDNYLLQTSEKKLASDVGVRLKKILQRQLARTAAATTGAAPATTSASAVSAAAASVIVPDERHMA